VERRTRERGAKEKRWGNKISAPLFLFPSSLRDAKKEREREERERRTNKSAVSLSLSLSLSLSFLRVSLRDFSSFSLQKVERNTSPKLRLLHVKGYYLGCKFKFPYSDKCFFQVFGGYLFTTSVSAQVVLFFQRRFWTARNTEILISLSWFPWGKKKGIIHSRRSPFILNPHALCKRKEHTHTHALTHPS
jgi:hypothetical protein